MTSAQALIRPIRLHALDNVAIALSSLPAGAAVAAISTREPIPAGFKIALRAIHVGEPVIRNGHVIGQASAEIQAGSRVDAQNAQGMHAEALIETPPEHPLSLLPEADRATFQGYVRADGRGRGAFRG